MKDTHYIVEKSIDWSKSSEKTWDEILNEDEGAQRRWEEENQPSPHSSLVSKVEVE